MKYLFIGAHTDDVEVSCGGTIAKLVEQGHEVECLALSYCNEPILLKEYANAADVLGMGYCNFNFPVRHFTERAQEIANVLIGARYFDFIFTHSNHCRHPDHRTVGQESLRVFNCNLLSYIQPWNGFVDDPDYFVELSEDQLQKKIQAINCYESQSHRNYTDPQFIHNWAGYMGMKCGKKYAEAFKVIRLCL